MWSLFSKQNNDEDGEEWNSDFRGWGGGGGCWVLGYNGTSQVDLYFDYLMNKNTLTHHFFL